MTAVFYDIDTKLKMVTSLIAKFYKRVDEIKVVIREIGEQVTARLQEKNEVDGTISLFVGYSYATSEMKHSHGFNVQTKIIPLNHSNIISSMLIQLFDAQQRAQLRSCRR